MSALEGATGQLLHNLSGCQPCITTHPEPSSPPAFLYFFTNKDNRRKPSYKRVLQTHSPITLHRNHFFVSTDLPAVLQTTIPLHCHRSSSSSLRCATQLVSSSVHITGALRYSRSCAHFLKVFLVVAGRTTQGIRNLSHSDDITPPRNSPIWILRPPFLPFHPN